MTGTLELAGAAAARTLIVAEKFAGTVQGEGVSRGDPAVFVRLSRCNLRCGANDAPFACDTPYTWDTSRFDLSERSSRQSVEDVAAWVLDQLPHLVVITGGEPLLQREPVTELVRVLTDAGRRVEFETNGTLDPGPDLLEMAYFNVSPKLGNAGMAAADRIRPDVLSVLAGSGRANFKFVACGPHDLAEVDALVEQFALAPVLIMPEGTDVATVRAHGLALIDAVCARGWKLTLRDHIWLFGDVPGR